MTDDEDISGGQCLDELIARLREQGVTDEELDAGVEVQIPQKDGGEPLNGILYRMKV